MFYILCVPINKLPSKPVIRDFFLLINNVCGNTPRFPHNRTWFSTVCSVTLQGKEGGYTENGNILLVSDFPK